MQVVAATGRFAPSPTGVLHLGNLRTALVSWCTSHGAGGRWLVRMEDLDPVTANRAHAARQLDHLARLGLVSDGPVVHQSDRFDLHRDAIAQLRRDGLVYPCYCTRREIRDAAAAPHGDGLPDGAYPGTCRELTRAERLERERAGRVPALRLCTEGERHHFDDLVLGPMEGVVDDLVLQRSDGVPAYNLAVVVDDHLQGVDQVVRGDDLASSTPRHLHLQQLLGLPHPTYAHVPLVLGPDGSRLAKRHGAVTLDDLAALGWTDVDVVRLLGRSLGVDDAPASLEALAARFSLGLMPRSAWRLDPERDLTR